MADTIASVLDYETKLAFRRLTEEGWVPGLPKRKRKSEYSDYGDDGEILCTLHSFFDAIKARFANRRNNKHFILTMMSVDDEIAGLIKSVGPSLWPSEQGRTPTFIDPAFRLDFSIEEHKDRIQRLFFKLALAKAFRYNENQSRSTSEAAQRQTHSTDDESGDASEYAPTPREIKKGPNKRARGTGKPRGPYKKTKRRLAELRASEDAQVTVENLRVDIGHRASASAEHSTPPVNDKHTPDDGSPEVIDLEVGSETLGLNVDATDPTAERSHKRRTVAVRCAPTKRPQRAKVVNRSPSDQLQSGPRSGAQPMQPAFSDVDNPPDALPGIGSHLSCLSGQRFPSEVPFSVSFVENACNGPPTNSDVPQHNFSDQIPPLDTLFPSTEVPKSSPRQLFEDQARTDEHTSHHLVNHLEIHEGLVESHRSQEGEPGTAAAASGLPSSTKSATPLQGELEQHSVRTRVDITSTAALPDQGSAAEVNMPSFPNTTKRIYSEPPLHETANLISPREADRRSVPATPRAQDSLDAILKDTNVRLCLGGVDEEVIMDLDGCRTMVDLVEKIKLYLAEEFGIDQISYVVVAQDCDQEFRVLGMKTKRLRLLPGPGRERTYDNFLCLLRSARSEDGGQFFKLFVHVKENRGV